MGLYKKCDHIGEGSFGRVYRGECTKTGQIVALKFIPKHSKGEEGLESLRQEYVNQRGLKHANIVEMLDYFETDSEVVAVCEFVPRTLCDLMKKNGLEEEAVQPIARDLVSALYYLHDLGIVHRDIKPQNILLTEDGVAKICDFGFSKKMEINTYVLKSIKGSPLYMAPEILDEQPYDFRADLWSFGCILFELLTGKPPFYTTSIVHLIEMVKRNYIRWPNNLREDCINYLKGLLQKDRSKRYVWIDLKQHAWVAPIITKPSSKPTDSRSLTSPLTQSQQQVKEHQMQQLVRNQLGQPKLLPRAIASKALQDAGPGVLHQSPPMIGLTPAGEDLPRPIAKSGHPPASFLENRICPSLEKMSLSNGGAVEGVRMGGEAFKVYQGATNSHEPLLSSISSPNNKAQTSNAQDAQIEEEEWLHFVNRTLADAMSGNLDVFTRAGEIAMFVSPLRNSSCPVLVAERIANLFMIPFVNNPKEEIMTEILNGFLEHRVVCNLLFACKNLYNSQQHEGCSDKALLDVITQMLGVVSQLVHQSNSAFITQFGEGVCVLNAYDVLGKCLLNANSSPALQTNVIVILSQTMRMADVSSSGVDPGSLVLKVISSISVPDSTSDALSNDDSTDAHQISALRYVLMTLLTHQNYLIRSKTCCMLGHLTVCKTSVVEECLSGQHKLLCDLINLENDSNNCVRRAASYAFSKLQRHTTIMSESQ